VYATLDLSAVPRKRGVLRPTLQGFRCAPASVHYRCGTHDTVVPMHTLHVATRGY